MAYARMLEVGFHQFGIHAAPHRPILGWQSGVSPTVKFALRYLFSQAEEVASGAPEPAT